MRYAEITDRLADTGGAKWAVHTAARARRSRGEEIIELTIGEPDVPTDPELVEVCAAAMRAGRTVYSNGRGEPELLAALAERYAERRPGVTPENILCLPGTQTALFATMLALTGPGDGVLVGDPYYATYQGVIGASGAHLQPVPLRPERGFAMAPGDLAASITPASRVMLLNAPHNPTGAVLDADTVAAIAQICARHDLWLVCDEVYEDLIFHDTFFSPFELPEHAERVVVLSSISKSYAAPGFRSGWAVGPVDFCNRVLPISEAMLFGGQPFIADMTAHALRNPVPTAARMRRDYHRRSVLIAEHLDAQHGLKAHLPRAGMFILIDVSSSGLTGEQFALRLLDAGVAVMPGSSFGAQAENFIRLSLTVPDAAIEQACGRILNFTGSLFAGSL